MLILNNTEPMHWALAGGAIALMTLTMLALVNRRLGISTGFESLCSLGLTAPYFQRQALRASNMRRLALFGGLVLGGILSASLSGGLTSTWDFGTLGESLGLSESAKLAWMFCGGLCIGFGTRLAGGCTSGHGIFGVSNFEASSWVSMLSFMAAGVATSHITYRLIWGA